MNHLNQEQLSKHFNQILKAKNLAASKVLCEEGDGNKKITKHKVEQKNIDFRPIFIDSSHKTSFNLPEFRKIELNCARIA